MFQGRPITARRSMPITRILVAAVRLLPLREVHDVRLRIGDARHGEHFVALGIGKKPRAFRGA